MERIAKAQRGWAAAACLLACSCTSQDRAVAPPSPPPAIVVPEAPEVSAVRGIARFAITAVLSKTTLMPAMNYGGHVGAGPTIRVHPGDRIQIDYRNALPTDNYTGNMSNLHFHGLVTPPVAPGDEVLDTMVYPDQLYHYDVLVGKTQEPGLYWYHPHAHGDTNRQVGLGGMSGAIVVEGIASERPALAKLPERILVLRDVMDDLSKNTLRDHPNDVPIDRDSAASNVPCAPIFGRHLTLNGATTPRIPVGDGGDQFIRFLNATGSRTLDLSIPGATLTLVEQDGVPLDAYAHSPATARFTHMIVPPGARIEFVASHLAAGMELQSACYDAGPGGDGDPAATLATFATGTDAKPETVGDHDHGVITSAGELRRALPAPSVHRTIVLSETNLNGDSRFAIDGKGFSMSDAPLFTAKSGTIEAWTIVNRSNEMHDFHIHQVHFVVTRVDGHTPPGPRFWRDSFPVPAALPKSDGALEPSRTELLVDFRDPAVRGTFVFHCHLLDHEDAGMMAKIAVR